MTLRDYAINKHGQVDDYPYGGGAGMVLMVEPIAKAIIRNLTKESGPIMKSYILTPDGETFPISK